MSRLFVAPSSKLLRRAAPTVIPATLEAATVAVGQRGTNGAVQRLGEAEQLGPDVASAQPRAASTGHRFRSLSVTSPKGSSETHAEVREAARHGTSGSGGPLPFLQEIQRSFGRHDVSGITAHTDGAAAAGTRAMGARAFAMDQHVAFAGPPDLRTTAHEAAHVIQQRRGVQLSGGVGREGDRYEQHADAVAERVVQGQSSEALLDAYAPPPSDPTRGSRGPAGPAPVQHNIQRAMGLEIEVAIPVDNLDEKEVYQLRQEGEKSLELKESSEERRSAAQKVRETFAKKKIQSATIFHDKAGGFRLDVDHDSRVKSGNFPPREAGNDAILEIVVDPPVNTEAEFRQTMHAISKFVGTVMANTQNLTNRWANAFGDYSIGPIQYPHDPARRDPEHNWQGSIQVNLGIDLRSYESLLRWYVDSEDAKPENSKRLRQLPPALLEKMAEERRYTNDNALYETINQDISQAADAAAEVTRGLFDGLEAQQREQMVDLNGIQGFLTHVALYLQRGQRASNSTIKNRVPALLKTPNYLVAQWGMSQEEQKLFNAQTPTILKRLIKRLDRADIPRRGKGSACCGGQTDEQWWDAVKETLVFPRGENEEKGQAGLSLERLAALEARATQFMKREDMVTDLPVGPARKQGAAQTAQHRIRNDDQKAPPQSQRGGMVVEFRNLPGLYDGPATWMALGLRFLKKADELNEK